MADVINRTTNEFRKSVNTPDFDEADWLINPDLSDVSDVPNQYWIVPEQGDGNIVTANRLQWKKDQKQNKINAFREQKLNEGLLFRGHVYDSDQRARDNITSMATSISVGAPLPENFVWRTADNLNIPMDAYDVIELGMAMVSRINSIYGVSFFHKDTVESLTDEASVDAYDYTVGWPATPL